MGVRQSGRPGVSQRGKGGRAVTESHSRSAPLPTPHGACGPVPRVCARTARFQALCVCLLRCGVERARGEPLSVCLCAD